MYNSVFLCHQTIACSDWQDSWQDGFQRHRRRCRPGWRRQMKWVEPGQGHMETIEKNRSILLLVRTALALSKNQRLLEERNPICTVNSWVMFPIYENLRALARRRESSAPLRSLPCCWASCLFSSPYHLCIWQIITLCASTPSISCLPEEIASKLREHSRRTGHYQRNDNYMFSLVSQKVMAQPPSANKKYQYEIRRVLCTGSFGKVMVCVRASRAYAL